MSTVTATSSTQNNVAAYDPYGGMFKTSMANDYLGQQIFGQGGMLSQTVPNTTASPKNMASAILQQYKNAAQGTTGGNYIQNYYTATMIANQISQSYGTLASPYTGFTKNDIFASQIFGPNGTGLRYTA